jgi:hypothetical protein
MESTTLVRGSRDGSTVVLRAPEARPLSFGRALRVVLGLWAVAAAVLAVAVIVVVRDLCD